MIDTIVFSIDLNVNKNALKNVRWYHEKTITKKATKDFKISELRTETTVFRNIHFNVPSSHNEILIVYNSYYNTLTINTSIPKYLFGNNVILLHDNEYSNDWEPHFMSIKKWIYKFFRKLQYITGKLDYNGILISRIDLCLNQAFDTKMDALLFIDECKRITFPYEHESNKYIYRTSVMFVGRSYSFKIYHKGTEFKKQKNVKNKEKIQPLADRVVRYELTFQKKYLSYLFRTKVYCNDDQQWKKEQNSNSKIYKKHIQKSIDIYLDLPDEHDIYNYYFEPENISYAYRIKKDLIKVMTDKFMSLYNLFNFTLPDIELPKKVRVLIGTYGSYKNAYKMDAISSATYYRNKNKYENMRFYKQKIVDNKFSNWKEFTIINHIIATK